MVGVSALIMAITERDERGRIVKSVISSEQAAEMGKRSRQVMKGTSRDKLLQEADYEDPDDAPEYLRILAKQALTSTPAMKAYLQLTKTVEDVKAEVTVQPGERCPTCHQYVLADMQMTEETLDSVIEGLDL